MFEIEALKEKKLPELQEIAEKIGVPKFRQLKKLDLVYQILDVQATKPVAREDKPRLKPRPQRKRIAKPQPKDTALQKQPEKQAVVKEDKTVASEPVVEKEAPKKQQKDTQSSSK